MSWTRRMRSYVPPLAPTRELAANSPFKLQLDQLELEGKGKAKLMVQVRAYRQEVKAWKAKVVRLCFSSSLPCILPPPTPSESGGPISMKLKLGTPKITIPSHGAPDYMQHQHQPYHQQQQPYSSYNTIEEEQPSYDNYYSAPLPPAPPVVKPPKQKKEKDPNRLPKIPKLVPAQANGMSSPDVTACKSLIKKLTKEKKSFIFRAPVDPIKAGAPECVFPSFPLPLPDRTSADLLFLSYAATSKKSLTRWISVPCRPSSKPVSTRTVSPSETTSSSSSQTRSSTTARRRRSENSRTTSIRSSRSTG